MRTDCTFAYIGSTAECTVSTGWERGGEGREEGGEEGGGGGKGAQGERPPSSSSSSSSSSSDVHVSLTAAGSFHIPPWYPRQPAKGEREDSCISCEHT